MHKVGSELTAKHEPSILKKFYRTTLRKGENIIDNLDGTIAKELGIQKWIVTHILTYHLNDKFNVRHFNV